MSIEVKVFDEENAKHELKRCPVIVRQYFKLINDTLERQKALTDEAIKKLRLQGQEITDLKAKQTEIFDE